MKICSKCFEKKELDCFSRSKVSKDGRYASCRSCRSREAKIALPKSKERRRANYLANQEARKQYSREWYASNRDKASETKKKYYNANKEMHITAANAWHAANPEKVRAAKRKWKRNNPDAVIRSSHTRRAKIKQVGGVWTQDDIDFLLKIQRKKCAHLWCRKSLADGYHRDHIIPVAKGGTNDRKNLQLLCPSCNHKKYDKHPIEFAQQHGMLL